MSETMTVEQLRAAQKEAKTKTAKYKNEPTYYKGERYESKGEAQEAERIDQDPNVWIIIRQPRFWLAGIPYHADWFVLMRNGSHHARDYKGDETQRFRDIKRLWAVHGPCDLWVIEGKGQVREVIEGGAAR